MNLTRRDILALGAAGVVFSGIRGEAFASLTDDEIAKITGGAKIGEGAVELTAPEIAENGNTVPISVSAPGAIMVTIFADGNPVPNVATFKFGALNPSRRASTRIRLAKSQNVVAIAQYEDGSFQKAQSAVKVTIGGCGG